MLSRLVQRRLIWWPTPLGWLVLLVLLVLPVPAWWFCGESFLAHPDARLADTLIVEGWIGYDGVHAAKDEFVRGGYRWIVTTGGFTNNVWGRQRWNYAELAQAHLLRLGVPADHIIAAPAPKKGSQRTFESAVAARDALQTQSLRPAAANIFTLGVHARRSRLVFSKVLPSDIEVGSIPWYPPHYGPGPWWRSSERAADMIKETVGYLFELLLNSGRTSNSPPPVTEAPTPATNLKSEPEE